jgi:benzodiazapine receptor
MESASWDWTGSTMGNGRKETFASAVTGIAISESAGLLGAWFTRDGVRNWYPALRKPSFTPPSSIFGPVWTTLYALMGIAVSIVWRRRVEGSASDRALGLFSAQLILNVLWSYAFFKRRSTGAGLLVIAPLWIFIVLTILAFLPVATIAGLLLIPYLLWTTFATALNLRIWQLNRRG